MIVVVGSVLFVLFFEFGCDDYEVVLWGKVFL